MANVRGQAAFVPKRVVIAGGTGFLGQNLARALVARGDSVVVLGRSEPTVSAGKAPAGRFVRWDAGVEDVHGAGVSGGSGSEVWITEIDGCDAVVNLAGRTVDCIKTPEHRDQILRSRVESTRAIGRAIHAAKKPPDVWVQMSTAHIYGDPETALCDEDSAFGVGLAPDVGKAWEREHRRWVEAEPCRPTRSVVLRTSFVIGPSGGALPRLRQLVRWRLGGRVGNGRQGMSWIHEADMDALMLRAIDSSAMQGVYVATAPNPASNAEFMRELRRACGVQLGLPAMAWMVRVGAPLLMRTDPELALFGRYCVSRRLREEGFEFRFPDLEAALRDACGDG